MATTDVETFLRGLSNVPAFSVAEYSSRLKGAILFTPGMNAISGYFKLSDEDKQHEQKDCHFGDIDCTDNINKLGAATASVVLSKLADDRKMSGFADSVCIGIFPVMVIV